MYNLGLVSVSFRQLGVDEIIAAVKNAGLTCIEWGSDVHAPCKDAERLRYISRRCAEENIEICSYGSYFTIGETPRSELWRYIDAAKLLGTDIIRVWAGAKGSAEYSSGELAAFCDECRALASVAAENGVTLCMECHNNTVTDTLDGALRLMKAVDSPNFRMYWQPNQFRTVGENLRYAREIAPYTTHVHVFNWDGPNMYPLEGAVGIWRDYLSQLGGSRHLLLEFMPDNRPEALPAEADALRKIAAP
mgnify:CR=1 FL=1